MDLGEEIDKSIDRVLKERKEKEEDYRIIKTLNKITGIVEIDILHKEDKKYIVTRHPAHLIIDAEYPNIILDELLKEMFEALRA